MTSVSLVSGAGPTAGRAVGDRGTDQGPGWLNTPDELDNHVQIVAGDQRCGIRGEQVGRQPWPGTVGIANRNPDQFESAAGSRRKIGPLLKDEPGHLT